MDRKALLCLCGVGALGGSQQCGLKLQPPSRMANGEVAQHAPVALLNPVTAQTALGPDGRWSSNYRKMKFEFWELQPFDGG